MSEEVKEVKPGFKTTEFWVTSITLIYTALISSGVIPHAAEVSGAVSAIAMCLVSFGYSWARALVKQK